MKTPLSPTVSKLTPEALDQLCINTIRMFAVDAVEQARSGHPGLPMGAASLAYVLWTKFLRHNPKNPAWPNRDRFVLSAGHGSMLLYALLHLTGYDLPLEELKRFRRWDSKTPGHPEHGHTPGVETTTGPLGQGFGNAVGMAMAEVHLAARFNRPGHAIVDHFTYVFASDGDLMEGVSHEAASLSGHLHLGKLIVVYLDNRITMEGGPSLAFTEDVHQRFVAYGWHVQHVDGNDLPGIEEAFRAAQAEQRHPSLIIARTHIGFGSPHKQDTAEAHGSPLGPEEVRLTKERLGWPTQPMFFIPEGALAVFRQAVERGAVLEREWQARVEAYRRAYPELAAEWEHAKCGELPNGWESQLPTFTPADGALATRQASGKVLNVLAKAVPWLIGGSADLAPSTNTYLKDLGDFQAGSFGGRNLHFGVREHAMGAILNGMALHGGLLPFGSTFLVFSDYMRPAIRLAALMKLHVVYVFTHDSIGLGEDGPTHQPIEHLASLRAIPNLLVIRPADSTEAVEAWKVAVTHHGGPVALVLTRQKLPTIDRGTYAKANGLANGAYVLADSSGGAPDLILITTGSEVPLALEAHLRLSKQGVRSRVVSMPSWELFEQQPQSYRDAVLPPSVTARLAVEAASPFGWACYVGPAGDVIGMTRFGASAPDQTLMKEFGFTVEHIVSRARALLETARRTR
jgi:transketolase